jgi:prepilin-type N-terminal cleavage/methylation domain-containing protein
MKKAFTMIELIFVIVILGILAAVALPKFIGVASQAHEANLKDFTGTLNRTVGASLWSKSMTEGKAGSIRDYNSSYGGSKFKALADIPKEIDRTTIDFGTCGTNEFNKTNPFAEANTTITGVEYNISCRDGNATTPPAWVLINKDGNCIAGPCEDY